jgi:hypothetical protein
MSPILRAGVSIVLLALASYTVGVVSEQRNHKVSGRAMGWLIAGVVFDVVATACMIIGSGNWMTIHGAIGYSALAAMLIETTMAWRHRRRSGEGPVSSGLHLYTRLAYGWWVVAFITGGLLVALSRTRPTP